MRRFCCLPSAATVVILHQYVHSWSFRQGSGTSNLHSVGHTAAYMPVCLSVCLPACRTGTGTQHASSRVSQGCLTLSHSNDNQKNEARSVFLPLLTARSCCPISIRRILIKRLDPF
ncbi:hypothetical protein QBC46DRAFT_165769 [Diplogelasinospora grovesii]|uniref:Uncharacterized protein n=1 Tax=Diplogelasinospora grovesii TaxID=303347 RepID=A0AAN6NFF5_9PEZI|nr:hypothetical protein QBC46DRAFT_165769 [Diplogelasinospora grovesii]